MLRLSVFCLSLLLTSDVLAHARLTGTTLPPRNTSDANKTAPCGAARTNNPKVLQAGETITITWEETVQHPGRFEFYFSESGDTNWQLLKTVQDTADDRATLPHRYSTTLQLPNTPCTACTIQFVQVMLDDPAIPRNYYSCADIQLTASSNPQPSATPSPQTPTRPAENCDDPAKPTK